MTDFYKPEVQAVLDLFESMGANEEQLHHEKTMLLADSLYLEEQLRAYSIPPTQFISEKDMH